MLQAFSFSFPFLLESRSDLATRLVSYHEVSNPLRDIVTQHFFGPTPTATLPISPGDDLFYFEAFPSGWGAISVDGHPIHQSVFFGALPIRLGRGAHQVIWQADPFKAEGCSLSWGFFAAKDRAAGCLGVAVPGDNTTSPTTPTKGAYFLYRFGMLLAVNNKAHQYFPDLPLADAYEQGIAQQIVTYHQP